MGFFQQKCCLFGRDVGPSFNVEFFVRSAEVESL